MTPLPAADTQFEARVAQLGGTTVLDSMAWVLAATLLAVHVGLLWRFAVDWPLHDDLTQILAVPGYLVQSTTLREQLAFLFALSPEHRIAVLRAIGWFGGLTTGLDFKLLILIGNAMGLAAVAFMIVSFPTTWRAGATLVGALLGTSITHYAAQYHATGALQHFGVLFWSFAALIALERGFRVPACILALLAIFTSANGLLVPTAAAVLLLLRHRPRESLVWFIAGIAAFVIYYAGGEGSHRPNNFVPLLSNPVALASSFLAALGSIAQTMDMSRSIGTLVVVAWLCLLTIGAWRRLPPLVVAFTTFAAMSCALIAAGRATSDVDVVTISRYRIYSAVTLLGTLCSVAWVIGNRARSWVFAAATIVAAVLYASAWPAMMPSLIDLNLMQLTLRDQFAADNSSHYDGFKREWGDFTLRRARELAVYQGMEKGVPPLPLSEAIARPETTGTPRSYVNVFAGDRVFSAYGHSTGRRRDMLLWLGNERRALNSPLITGLYIGPGFRQQTAFRGTFSLSGVPSGTYLVGLSDRSGDVQWTQHMVEVR